MRRTRVGILSGSIPSTVFIERLIEGLSANENISIYVFGRVNAQLPKYYKNAKALGFTSNINLILVGLKFRLLFLFKPQLWAQLNGVWKAQGGLKAKLKLWGRTLPIVYSEIDILHIQWVKDVRKFIFLEELGVKVIASLRGGQVNYEPLANPALAMDFSRLFKKCSAFHGVSQAIVDEACKYASIADRSKVVYSGLSLVNYPFKEKKPSFNSPLKLISVGRPHWKKGYQFSIDACKVLAENQVNFEYVIVGGVSEEFQFQIYDLGLESQVKLVGHKTHDEVKSLMANSDILILPSVEEGIANVVLEAMALGTIVLSTTCGGMKEVLRDEYNGFLVPTRSSESIALKINDILKFSPTAIEKIRINARSTIEVQFSDVKMVEDMLALYQSVEA